jgi:hypothetical protein
MNTITIQKTDEEIVKDLKKLIQTEKSSGNMDYSSFLDFYNNLNKPLQNNLEIVSLITAEFPTFYRYASRNNPNLGNNKQVVLDILHSNFSDLSESIPYIVSSITPELQKDKNIMMRAISLNPLSLESANVIFKKDFDVVLRAVSSNGEALKYADDQFKSDLKIVIPALKQTLKSIPYTKLELWESPEILLKEVDFPDFICFCSIYEKVTVYHSHLNFIKEKLATNQKKDFALHVEPQMVEKWKSLLKTIDMHRQSNDYLFNEMMDIIKPMIRFWSIEAVQKMSKDAEKMKTKYPEYKALFNRFFDKEIKRKNIMNVNQKKSKDKILTKPRKMKI